MAVSVRIVDEHFGSSTPVRRPACELRLASERATPREIIRRRVEAEVDELNRAKAAHIEGHARTRSFLVIVDSDSAEAKLNRPLLGRKKPRLLDLEHESTRALEAFEKRAFIMLFDDRQIDDADEEVTLTPASEVSFVYLTPLKGG